MQIEASHKTWIDMLLKCWTSLMHQVKWQDQDHSWWCHKMGFGHRATCFLDWGRSVGVCATSKANWPVPGVAALAGAEAPKPSTTAPCSAVLLVVHWSYPTCWKWWIATSPTTCAVRSLASTRACGACGKILVSNNQHACQIRNRSRAMRPRSFGFWARRMVNHVICHWLVMKEGCFLHLCWISMSLP